MKQTSTSTPSSFPQHPTHPTQNKINPREHLVTLQPVAMVIPNAHCVYSPSRIEPKKEISYDEFLTKYANHPRSIHVCFDEKPSSTTVFERSEIVTAYGIGLDCWYIVVSPDIVLDDN